MAPTAPPDSVTAFAPASVSNLACGFDVLGAALEHPGDRVTAVRSDTAGARVLAVAWPEEVTDPPALPLEPDRNTASVAAAALLRAAGVAADVGVALTIRKGLPLAGGLGGSAASAVAAVVAVDALLGLGASREDLLESALAGEEVAAGARHGDNVAPCLLGGFVLVRSVEAGAPPDVVTLEAPDDLRFVVAHPHVRVATREARDVLPRAVPLADAVRQWANVGALVAALARGDWELLGRSLEDRVAEPVRGPRTPGYDVLKRAALDAGAVGANLSGSGPTVFALCRGDGDAGRVLAALEAALAGELATRGIGGTAWVSPVAAGARVEGG
jgi:homoserine kinase